MSEEEKKEELNQNLSPSLVSSPLLLQNSLSFVPKNLLLAFCLDGNVYAIEADSGRVLWKSREAFTEGPLLTRGKRMNKNKDEFEYLVEPLEDGPLFLIDRRTGSSVGTQTNKDSGATATFREEEAHENDRISKLPYTLKGLVQASPVRILEPNGKSLYIIARRETRIFAIDLGTSVVVCKSFNEGLPFNMDDVEDEDREDADIKVENSLLIGRNDYHVQAFDEETLQLRWEQTLTQFKSLSNNANQSESIESSKSGFNFYPTFNGHLVAKSENDQWIVQLSSPIVQLFEALMSDSSKKSFVLNEIQLKSSATVARHVEFDKQRSTFYFDHVVNFGVMNEQVENEIRGIPFVLPQDTYPVLKTREKVSKRLPGSEGDKERDRREREIGIVPFRSNCRYLGSQRIARQIVPTDPPLLLSDYSQNNLFITSHDFKLSISITILCILVGVYFYFFRRKKWRRNSQSSSQPQSSLLQVSQEVLGYGSDGTVVFKGRFDGRDVAIKRLLAEFYDIADREISLLQEHDNHTNIIRYFYREKSDKFILIALELASCTLHEWTESETYKALKTKTYSEKVEVLRQIMEGVVFLHGMNLVHRDLKPQNILLQLSSNRAPHVLISDFGLSRRLVEQESSLNATTAASGTVGWRAPEIIFNDESVKFQRSLKPFSDLNDGNNESSGSGSKVIAEGGPIKIGKSVDIFAAGLIFYYVLSEGEHVFGPRLLRESNIATGRVHFESQLLCPEAEDLIFSMVQRKPKDRPTGLEVLKHPFFWDNETQLTFICAVSDVLEAEEKFFKETQQADAPPGFAVLPMREAVNTRGIEVFQRFGGTWHRSIDRLIFQDLTKHRFYNVNFLHDLLRAIRNKRNHYNETPAPVQEVLGKNPLEAWTYFKARFPRILMAVYLAMTPYSTQEITLQRFYST